MTELTGGQIYKDILDKILDGVLIADFKGKVLYGNQGTAKIMGFDNAAEGIGANVLDYAAPESKKQLIKDFFNVWMGKEGYLAEFQMIRKDGKRIWIQNLGRKIKYQGKTCVLASFRDITELKQMSQALKKSEERASIFFKLSPDAIFFIDDQGVVVDINDAVERFTGYPADQIKGKHIEELPFLPEQSRKLAMDNMVKRIQGLPTEPYEAVYLTKNNEKRIGLVKAQIVRDEAGRVLGEFAIIIDITQMHEAEQKLQKRAQELERFNKLAVGRELEMVKLKSKIKELEAKN
jgi:PAS domain S-box-containing protein